MDKKWFYIQRWMAVRIAYWDTNLMFGTEEELLKKISGSAYTYNRTKDNVKVYELTQTGEQKNREDLVEQAFTEK